ncbi:hypothetical protein [Mesorhizobium sp. M0676]|uniref:hypothetical protein n=1 Tax=Mesorhizobium sp. M0676 TaxID=2956984 RepID=UPI003334F1DB
MKIGEWPAPIKDVWSRRVVFAPRDFQIRAFGASPVKSGYWRHNELHIFAFGSAEFVTQVANFDVRYGYPLPGITSDSLGGRSIGFEFKNARRISFHVGLIDQFSQPIFVNPEHGGALSALIWDTGIKLPVFGVPGVQFHEYRIPGAFVARLATGFSWEEAATDFDLMLAKAISPSIERRK